MAKVKQVDISELTRLLADGLKNHARKPNIFGYQPHAKQDTFHKLQEHARLYIGGNRSGKSYAAVAEDVWWLTNTHPFRETPELPVRGRVVTVDFTYGLEQIIIPLFKILLPASELIDGSWEASYSKSLRVLTLKNGSTVEFMSYEQDTEKFAGTSRHFVHYDEEPPLHIFNECNARLVDTDGSYWISMTPVEGLTWTYEKIFEPWEDKTDPNIGVVVADMLDNPYITKEASERYLSGLDDDERKAREHGTYVQLGGLVYKTFQKDTHVIPIFLPPKDWTWYCSLDHGYNNPTAVLWHAVSPLNYVVTFDEWYYNEKTLDEVAAAIHAKNEAHGKKPDFYCADPAISQRSAHNGTSIQTEYAVRGIYFALGNNDVLIGVAKVQNYLKVDVSTGIPRYQITENCANYINEMTKLRWKTFASKKMQFNNNAQESIHKKNDHACDSARYFFSFLPDLAPAMVTDDFANTHPGKGQAGGDAKVYGNIDQVIANMTRSSGSPRTQWNNEINGTDLQGLEYE